MMSKSCILQLFRIFSPAVIIFSYLNALALGSLYRLTHVYVLCFLER